MQESTIPLIAAITILGVVILLFFVNEFFRKYKVVKKRKPRKRKTYPKPRQISNDELREIILNARKAQKYFKTQQNNTK